MTHVTANKSADSLETWDMTIETQMTTGYDYYYDYMALLSNKVPTSGTMSNAVPAAAEPVAGSHHGLTGSSLDVGYNSLDAVSSSSVTSVPCSV